MPTITLDKKVLLKSLGKKLKDDTLKHHISYLGTDLESIDKKEIIVEIFPNRPDLLSEQGFSRALASFAGMKTGLAKYEVKEGGGDVIIDKSVEEVRPYTVCAVIRNLKLDHERIIELINIQEKLHITYGRQRKKVAIGIYPLENISMPIHYTALPPEEIKFRPLESEKVMTAKQILEKHPKGKEYAHLLEGKNKYPVFMDSEDRILSMPPIINSHDVGKVTEKTKDIFVECSGSDKDTLLKTLNILVTTMADMGAEIYSMRLKYYDQTMITPMLEPEEMMVELDYVNKKLGLDLTNEEYIALLRKMGYEYDRGLVLVPAYRADIMHPIDIVEDVAIAYGYDNFEEKIPDVSTIGGKSNEYIFSQKIREVLTGHGLIEVKNYTLTRPADQNDNMLSEMDLVEIENSLSEEYNSLRTWLLPCLMKNVSQNKHREYPQNIFEIGKVFIKKNGEVKEPTRAAVILCGEDTDYTKAKQVLDSIFESLGIEAAYKETKHDSFIKGRVARVSVGKKGVAYVGEMNPQVLDNFGIEMPVAAFELNLTDLQAKLK